MNTNARRIRAGFAAACILLLSAPGTVSAARDHALLDPDNPADLLEYAKKASKQMDSLAERGQTDGLDARAFKAKVKEFALWYESCTHESLRVPGSIHFVEVPLASVERQNVKSGEDFKLDGDIRVYPVSDALRTKIGWPRNVPMPDDGVGFLIGTFTNGVLLVTPEYGRIKILSTREYQKLCGNANLIGGSVAGTEKVRRRQRDDMLVALYADLGLPRPQTNLEDILPYLLVGGLALFVVILALVLSFRRKAPRPVAAVRAVCPSCGAPLMPDGRCPAGCGGAPSAPEPVLAHDAAPAPAAAPHEHCPTCGSELVDGVCPTGCTLVRCPTCDSLMVNGVCPVCGKQEICPTCGSELVDGVCPTGCTLVRCPTCDRILVNGLCPNGCNAAPLSLGWPGATKPTLSPYKLEVLAPSKYASVRCELPYEAVAGRSASEKKTTEVYIEFRFDDKRKAQACSRRYVRFVCDPASGSVVVELLSTSGRAIVAGKVLASQGEKAELPVDGVLDLPNAGYKLRLVRA